MKHYQLLLLVAFLLFTECIYSITKLQKVYLSKYGDTNVTNINRTLCKAISHINGKCLILPNNNIDLEDIVIKNKSNFEIEGRGKVIICGKFIIENCSNFQVKQLNLKGTIKKFTYFDVIGDCSNFSIHNCTFDSDKDKNNLNTFYGIHVHCDFSNNNNNFSNSPRNFSIYNNTVSNAKYDGILVHASCSNFTIRDNIVRSAGCIGIEVEGRLGGNDKTSVCGCKNVNIINNKISNCGDWGFLLMWVKNIVVS